jgi:hypothetical protein
VSLWSGYVKTIEFQREMAINYGNSRRIQENVYDRVGKIQGMADEYC